MDRIKNAFPAQRVVAPAPDLFDRAGVLFRTLHGDGRGFRDRLGVINDLLIALSAWRIGATVVTVDPAPGMQADTTATAAELMDFVKARLSDYKRVREVEFIEKVPRTASGKILRRELADRERAKSATP